MPEAPAWASGGSTAGKYSTIPSAKRKFYGRVRQGIFQFLQMEKPIMAGALKDETLSEFFAKNIIKRKGGLEIKNCIGLEEKDCMSKEKRTSRWLDMKVASDLLASGFRYSSSDVNDYLPQVRLIRAYAKKIESLKVAIEKGETEEAQGLYKLAKLDLAKYVPMVELEPLDSEDYKHSWDVASKVWCQGNVCY